MMREVLNFSGFLKEKAPSWEGKGKAKGQEGAGAVPSWCSSLARLG